MNSAQRKGSANTLPRIEVLYFGGCPHYAPAVDMVKSVVADLGIDAEIVDTEVLTEEKADRLLFLGSPTIRVDGIDIDPAARGRTDYALTCRLYGSSGVPPREMLLTAINAPPPAAERPRSGKDE